MSSMLARIVSLLTVGEWVGVLVARGRFWDPPADRLSPPAAAQTLPDVRIVVPARDEAAMLPRTLPGLLAQRYPGRFSVVLADDHSTDATAACARSIVECAEATDRFLLVEVPPRPVGWAGKVWALACGVRAARHAGGRPAYWLFTDADIQHPPDALARLVATALADDRDIVSQMVQLHCESGWERLLIPAFVFFFAKLYPFAWIADDRRSTAAAAGGCLLISDAMLTAIGDVERIAGALIDDCTLAAAVKERGGRVRLELSTTAASLRRYDSLWDVWDMVARSAYTQLRESPVVLAGTIAGMGMLYVLPPAALFAGLIRRDRWLTASGTLSWSLMAFAYAPMLRRYRQPRAAAVLLPLAAGLYTAMTIDSARRHWRGRGGAWKGRLRDVPDTPLADRPPTPSASAHHDRNVDHVPGRDR